MSTKLITFTYPINNSCAVNVDFEGTEYILQWYGDWREIPDLTQFPSIVNTTVTPVPHTSSVDELWSKSQVLKFGADSHLRLLHSCVDDFPICKVAIDFRQRYLIKEEFSILRHLASQNTPIVRTHEQPLVDEDGIFGFRMEQLVEGKVGTTHIQAITKAIDSIHKVGILHHDLSPNNILLNQKGLIRIIDFGRSGYVGKEIPRYKLIGREPATSIFSTDADLLKLDETISRLKITGLIT